MYNSSNSTRVGMRYRVGDTCLAKSCIMHNKNDIYRITNDTKLRNFQFKLLHHILPNNKLLHKMGIKNSALCNFCNQEEDSILHYLWGCPVAKRFWTSFNNWLS